MKRIASAALVAFFSVLPTAAAAPAREATEVRLESLDLSWLLPAGWEHRFQGADQLAFSTSGGASAQVVINGKHVPGRECDWLLDQVLSTLAPKFVTVPASDYVKRWHPRARLGGARGRPGEPAMMALMLCAEPRLAEFVVASVELHGDMENEQQMVALLAATMPTLDSIIARIEATPSWRLPSHGKTELRLPKTAVTVQLPRSGAEWELSGDQSGPADNLVRVRPASPTIHLNVSVRSDLRGSQCARYLEQIAKEKPGATSYAPSYLPSGWHPAAFRFANSSVVLVCGSDSVGRMVLATPSLPADVGSDDHADLKAMLERVGVAVGMPGVNVSPSATASVSSRPDWASAASAAPSPAVDAQASSSSPPAPAPESAPTSTPTYEAPSYSETPSYSYGSRLGQLYSLWYVGGLRSGGDHLPGTYGGLVGNDRLYLVEHGPLALRLAGWIGYGPTDGLAGDAALAVGLGPIGDDEQWAILAMTGVGVTRYGAELYPATFVAHAELRGRLRLDSLGFEGALGYYPAAGYAEDSVRLDLRLYFALGQGQSWMVSWRRAIFEGFDYDQLVLGFGF